MTEHDSDQRRAFARAGFKRLLVYLAIAGVLMVAAAITYLASYGALTGTLVFTVTAGVFVSVMLGGGLMAAGFFSSDSGHDDEVAGAVVDPGKPTGEDNPAI